MLELWGAGDYYDGLPQPDAAGLEQIVVRKFAAYAMQGVFLNASEPNTILVQTERPALLRTRMLNIGRVFLNMPKIPAIYQRLSREDLVEQSCVELASDALG